MINRDFKINRDSSRERPLKRVLSHCQSVKDKKTQIYFQFRDLLDVLFPPHLPIQKSVNEFDSFSPKVAVSFKK